MQIKFIYRNYREEIDERTVEPFQIVYIKDPPQDAEWYHKGNYEPGWYLIGRDVEKDAIRTFALSRIIPREGFPLLVNIGGLTETISQLRKERVLLQDENDMLRNEVKQAVSALADRLGDNNDGNYS